MVKPLKIKIWEIRDYACSTLWLRLTIFSREQIEKTTKQMTKLCVTFGKSYVLLEKVRENWYYLIIEQNRYIQLVLMSTNKDKKKVIKKQMSYCTNIVIKS